MDTNILQSAIVSFVSFALGNLTGYFLRGVVDDKIKDESPNTLVLIAVTTVWVISTLVDMASLQYETPLVVHGLMGGIVGFFFKNNADNKK